MKRLLKNSVLSLAIAATALNAIPAEAGDWRHGGYYGDHHRYERHGGHHRHHVYRKKRKDDGDDLLVAGILGLAVGAIAAGVLTQQNSPAPRYIDPPQPMPPHPGYGYGSTAYQVPEPWTAEWYRACGMRYRSFDPRSGTFMGYDGKRHFCVIR